MSDYMFQIDIEYLIISARNYTTYAYRSKLDLINEYQNIYLR